MINYIKTLFPWRWTALAAMFIFLECLYYFCNMSVLYEPGIFCFANFVNWIILDLTAGIGRENNNVWKTLIGVLYLLAFMAFIIFDAYNRFGVRVF